LRKQGQRPLLVAADMYRPAAVNQLKTLGKQINVPVYSEPRAPILSTSASTRWPMPANRLSRS